MTVRELDPAGLLLLSAPVHRGERGFFYEFWHSLRDASQGLGVQFVQDNIAHSRRGALRGLHFQHPESQGKLIGVPHGEVFDVAVDLRRESKTYGKWTAVTLTGGSGDAVYIPEGFAHGYQVLSDEAIVVYKCTTHYNPANDRAIAWNDPDLAITWPLPNPILSTKDAQAPSFAEMSRLF